VKGMSVLPWALVPSLVMLAGCADKAFYNLQTPATSQVEQYVEASGLSKLPNKRLAITSFGVEFQTRIFHENDKVRSGKERASITTVDNVEQDALQQMTDDLYAKLVADLKAAGYEVIAPDALKAHPKYQQLASDTAASTAPQPITFKHAGAHGGIGDLIVETAGGDGTWSKATVFSPAPTGFYLPRPGERGSRLDPATIASAARNLALTGEAAAKGGARGALTTSGQEQQLAKDLNASLLKVYYVVSPVRSWVDSGMSPGKDWAKGKTLKYAKGLLDFTDRPLVGSYLARGNTIIGEAETHWAIRTSEGQGFGISGGIGGGMLGKKGTPPKDGDVLVQLKNDVQIDSTDESTNGIQAHLKAVQEMFLAKLKTGK
jgi:hypothetical protein